MTTSIIIPVYNKEAYVKQAVESALNQIDSDIEVIAIDDGSIDRSLRMFILSFKDMLFGTVKKPLVSLLTNFLKHILNYLRQLHILLDNSTLGLGLLIFGVCRY